MANGNPFFVEAAPGNIGDVFSGLGSILDERQEAQKQQAQQQALQAALASKDPRQVAQAAIQYPDQAEGLMKAYGFQDDRATQEGAGFARELLTAAPERRQELYERRIKSLEARGLDPTETAESYRDFLSDPEGELRDMEVFLASADPKGFEAFTESREDTGAELKVGAQEILEDGTIVQSTDRGPVVYNPQGERVKGQAAADAVKQAQAEKVSNSRLAAGGRRRATLEAEKDLKAEVEAGVVSAKDAAKASVDAFNKLQAVQKNISNINEAIDLIDQGASTGAVQSRLPSVRAASVKLDNLQGRLGLDVLQNTTFGSLSEGELNFALDTALPKGLQGPDLKNWLTEKRDAQEKLADYLEAAAIYLGTPGNTHGGWVQKQRDRQRRETQGADQQFEEGQTATNPQTGERMTFTNGQWQRAP